MSVEAIVTETLPGLDLSDEALRSAVEEELASRAGGWVYNIINMSSELGLDFLGLGRRLELEHAARWRALPEPWERLLPELELEVRASARLLNAREFAKAPDWGGAS